MAPLAPTAVVHATSPMLNVDDGIWNHGESPVGTQGGSYASTGGFLGINTTPPVLGVHVHRYASASGIPPPNWYQTPVTSPAAGPIPAVSGNPWRLRGYFHPTPLPAGAQVVDGAFEVLAEEIFDPGKLTVIVISTPSTLGGPALPTDGIPPDFGRFAYPGHLSPSGLSDTAKGAHWVNVRLLLKEQSALAHVNLICAAAVPRMYGRPMTFELQRALQLVQSVQAMLQSPDPNWRPANWPQHTANSPVMIEGGSFGGWLSQWAVILFPEHFHGAFSSGASASFRRTWQEQELWRYLNGMSGFLESGRDWGPADTIHSGGGLWHYRDLRAAGNPGPWATWSPFFHSASTRQWQDGRVFWPMYFWVSDEDPTGTGNDWLPMFDGIAAYHDHGSAQPPGRPPVYWSVVDRRCHEGGLHRTGTSGTLTWEHHDDQLEFLKELVLYYQQQTPPLPTYPPPGIENATEDPLEHVYAAQPALQVPSTPLRLDQTLAGSGTSLGSGDSLVVRNGSVFVGSAEGIVTCSQVNPVTMEMVPQQTSVALGYGAWGLAVGNVDPGLAGDEVVVATHRGLFVLDSGLDVQHSLPLPWHQSRPHHLQLANVVTAGGDEILLATELGDLVIFGIGGGQLAEVARYGEPGIVDLLVLGTNPPVVDLAILSDRGHLVKIQWDTSNPTSPVQVVAVSARLNGIPKDLEFVPIGGQQKIAVLLAKTPLGERIQVFNPGDLSVATPTAIDWTPLGLGGTELDLEVVQDASGQPVYAVLDHGQLFLIDVLTGAQLGFKNLYTFAPMMHPLDISIGELGTTLLNNQFSQEIAISTGPGYVSWLPLDCMIAFGGDIPVDPNLARGGGASMFCNRTLAATWAMTVDPVARTVELADQSGTRWRVDAQGNAQFVYEMWNRLPHPSAFPPAILRGPIRDLVHLQTTVPLTLSSGYQGDTLAVLQWSTGPGSSDLLVRLPAGTVAQRVDSYPYVGHVLAGKPAPALLPFPTSPSVGFGTWHNDYRHALFLFDGYALCPHGGDVRVAADPAVPAADRQLHWWGGHGHDGRVSPDLVQGLYLSGPTVLDRWATLRGPSLLRSPTPVAGSTVEGNDLRNAITLGFTAMDMQALRLFRNPTDSRTLAALGTPGGSLFVLRPGVPGGNPPDIGAVLAEGEDLGHGGPALAVADRGNETLIYFGVVAHHPKAVNHMGPQTAQTPADDIDGALAVYRWDGSALTRLQLLVLDGSTPAQPKAFGVAGLRVGDAVSANAGDELVGTTLDGQLFVWALQPNGTVAAGAPLYHARVEGALGVFNSIEIADLDQDGKREVWVAGSLGLRRFEEP